MSDRNYKPSLLPPRLSQKKLYSPRPSSRTGGGFSVLRSGATTILYSQKYVTLYFMVVFLNYFLLMWFIVGIVSDLGNGINGGGVVFWLELIATMLLALEDLLHILSIGALRNFINHQSNVYDTAVIFVSAIVLLITSISDYIKERYPRSVFSSITICLRLIAQQLGLIAVIKNQYRNYNSQTRVGFNVGSRPITPNKSSSRARTLPVLTPAISLPTPLLGESSEDGRELSTRLSGSSSSSSIYGNKGGSGFGKSRPLVYKDVDALSVDDGEYNNLSNASNDYDAAENIFKDSSYDDGMYSDDIIDIVSPKKH